MKRAVNIGSIVIIIFSVLTLIFLVMTMAKGENGPITAFLGLSSVALAIATILAIVLGIRGSLYDKKTLRNSIIGVAVIVVLYFIGMAVFQKSEIPEIYVQKKMATQSDWNSISGGLFVTYILCICATLLMAYSFIKGLIRR